MPSKKPIFNQNIKTSVTFVLMNVQSFKFVPWQENSITHLTFNKRQQLVFHKNYYPCLISQFIFSNRQHTVFSVWKYCFLLLHFCGLPFFLHYKIIMLENHNFTYRISSYSFLPWIFSSPWIVSSSSEETIQVSIT